MSEDALLLFPNRLGRISAPSLQHRLWNPAELLAVLLRTPKPVCHTSSTGLGATDSIIIWTKESHWPPDRAAPRAAPAASRAFVTSEPSCRHRSPARPSSSPPSPAQAKEAFYKQPVKRKTLAMLKGEIKVHLKLLKRPASPKHATGVPPRLLPQTGLSATCPRRRKDRSAFSILPQVHLF